MRIRDHSIKFDARQQSPLLINNVIFLFSLSLSLASYDHLTFSICMKTIVVSLYQHLKKIERERTDVRTFEKKKQNLHANHDHMICRLVFFFLLVRSLCFSLLLMRRTLSCCLASSNISCARVRLHNSTRRTHSSREIHPHSTENIYLHVIISLMHDKISCLFSLFFVLDGELFLLFPSMFLT